MASGRGVFWAAGTAHADEQDAGYFLVIQRIVRKTNEP